MAAGSLHHPEAHRTDDGVVMMFSGDGCDKEELREYMKGVGAPIRVVWEEGEHGRGRRYTSWQARMSPHEEEWYSTYGTPVPGWEGVRGRWAAGWARYEEEVVGDSSGEATYRDLENRAAAAAKKAFGKARGGGRKGAKGGGTG